MHELHHIVGGDVLEAAGDGHRVGGAAGATAAGANSSSAGDRAGFAQTLVQALVEMLRQWGTRYTPSKEASQSWSQRTRSGRDREIMSGALMLHRHPRCAVQSLVDYLELGSSALEAFLADFSSVLVARRAIAVLETCQRTVVRRSDCFLRSVSHRRYDRSPLDSCCGRRTLSEDGHDEHGARLA